MDTKPAKSDRTTNPVMLPIAGMMLPSSSHIAHSDAVRASTEALFTDAVITAKIKIGLAEQKLSNLLHIHVDTMNHGIVTLSGTAMNPSEASKAGSIARGVKSVTSVENRIKIAGAT